MLDTDNGKNTTWLKFVGSFLLCSQRRVSLLFMAKLEYYLEILIYQLKDLTKKNLFLKKSKTMDAFVQKIQLDEHGKFCGYARGYVMFATMDMLIYGNVFLYDHNNILLK
jgi:hypothetical protein